MQVIRNHVNLVYTPHLDLDMGYDTRRDLHNHCRMCSRDRSRRT